jgi:hypothetical protein
MADLRIETVACFSVAHWCGQFNLMDVLFNALNDWPMFSVDRQLDLGYIEREAYQGSRVHEACFRVQRLPQVSQGFL